MIPRTTDRGAMVLEHLRGQQPRMLELLERFATIESPSSNPASQRPVQELLIGVLEALGFRTRHTRGRTSGGCLLAVPRKRPAGAPIQVLLGHCDTVWPHGTLKSMPVRRADGVLHGPGVFDMKGGLVQMLFALEALRDLELEPAVAPVVFVNSDEEIGSFESMAHIRRLARVADRVLVVEPALGPDGRLKTARKGVGRFRVRVVGRSAHAGLDPEKGASAVRELADVVRRLFAMNDADRGISVNVGTVGGGIATNVIAPEAWATVDVRVLQHDEAREIERAILGMTATTPGTHLEVTGSIRRPPLERTPRNRRLWERAVAAADELGLEIDEATAGGGSDGNTTSEVTATLDGLGAVGAGAHAPDEQVVVARLPERAALLALLMLDPPMCDERDAAI